MTVPKVWMVQYQYDEWFVLLAEAPRWEADASVLARRGRANVADELAKSGQRITIPDDVQPGWHAAPEDIPITPPPPPELWVAVWPSGRWTNTAIPPVPELRRAWAENGATAVYHLSMEDSEIRHTVEQP